MKKQTRAQQYNDLDNAVKKINSGKNVKRIGLRDGSIATKPVVPVAPLPEKTVLSDCLEWLRRHHIFCNRHDAGTFQNDRGQWGAYGIKGAGDIIGILHSNAYYGVHFEVECKRGQGGRLSIEQQKRMKGVQDSGGLYFVVHGWQELEHYMETYV